MIFRTLLLGGAALFIALAAWLASSNPGLPPTQPMDRPAFDAAIVAMARDDTPSSSGMWRNPTLRALAGMGATSVDDALAFLDCGCRSLAEAQVTVRAMYLLPHDHYLQFISGLAKLFDRDAVSAEVVALAVQVPDAFSTDLQRFFDEPLERQTLTDIAGRTALPPGTGQAIDDILSGRSWARTKSFCRDRIFSRSADCRTLSWLDLL